jgi:hypothetical protein
MDLPANRFAFCFTRKQPPAGKTALVKSSTGEYHYFSQSKKKWFSSRQIK